MSAGFEALATLLPVMRVILETQAAQVADSNSEQLVNATSKVLLGWMTNSNPEQRGESSPMQMEKGEMSCLESTLTLL